MNDIELRQIRYFMTLSKELHFGRAAQKLHMSQPALSQQIASLEESLGVQLFNRDRRQVHLTSAGAVLKLHSLGMIEAFEETVREVKKAGLRTTETIHIGAFEYSDFQFLTEAMRKMQKHYPKVKFARQSMATIHQGKSILSGEIDIGLGICLDKIAALKSISYTPLYNPVWSVLVPNDHPFAKKKFLTLPDLDHENLISFSKQSHPTIHKRVWSAFEKAKSYPNVVFETNDISLGVKMCISGAGMMLVSDNFLSKNINHHVLIRLKGLPEFQVGFYIRKEGTSPLILDFAECLVESRTAKTKLPSKNRFS